MNEATTPANQPLADALTRSVVIASQPIDQVEEDITTMAYNIKSDTSEYNGRSATKQAHTIAALLCYSESFRNFARQRGVNISVWDNQIRTLREQWQLETSKQPAGIRFVNVLRKITGL